MDQLNAMRAFVRVVEVGTFTRAAELLDLPKPTVTKLIQQLEGHLHAQLLNRTTRRVTVTMDGDEAGDEFDLRDVPWVQYFTEGYALHAAYWHDDFGVPRSHGCVNLAPLDASWLFEWTDPEVPEGWNAAL